MNQDYLPAVITIAEQAGQAILRIYQQDSTAFNITGKDDLSPLTAADLASHNLIVRALSELAPQLPVLSEEAADISWDVRQTWQRYWLVDPLDGTKEFIKRNGEFTVNIALIEQGEPVLGVIHVPVNGKTYYAVKGAGSFLREQGKDTQLTVAPVPKVLRVVGSRSHPSPQLQDYLQQFAEYELLSVGSSLKFCLIAEGKADIYPRFNPTMQWDTAAGHIIATEAGASVVFDGLTDNIYQREQLLNPGFIVSSI